MRKKAGRRDAAEIPREGQWGRPWEGPPEEGEAVSPGSAASCVTGKAGPGRRVRCSPKPSRKAERRVHWLRRAAGEGVGTEVNEVTPGGQERKKDLRDTELLGEHRK